MRYIDKILNHFGYYKAVMPKGTKLSEGEVLELLGSYGDVEKFRVLLRDLCSQDRELYFRATSDRDRNVIRGAHDRCLYFLSLIQKVHAKRKNK